MPEVYTPDSWVIIKMKSRNETFYKVLGGWSSSYIYGSSWRLNSGTVSVEEDGDHYEFLGNSGSTYRCHKESYGLRTSTIPIWDTMKRRYPEDVEVLEDRDWSTMEWK